MIGDRNYPTHPQLFSPCLSKYLLSMDNIQYIIEKPYKMVTKNAKKNSNFSTFVRFLGPFMKKQSFWKMGNFEMDENF